MARKLASWWRAHGWLTAAAGLTLVAIWAVLWPLTDVLAAHDVGAITGPDRVLRLQSAYEAVRTQLLTLGAGVFATGALIYTARNFSLSQRAYRLTEQGHVSDRYTRSIEQLGSDAMDVRIGGIFALERIARDSARDHPMVMEVLAAFIREHSHEPLAPPAAGARPPGGRRIRPDVQAALTVIGRRDVSRDGWGHIGLTGAVLHRRIAVPHKPGTRSPGRCGLVRRESHRRRPHPGESHWHHPH